MQARILRRACRVLCALRGRKVQIGGRVRAVLELQCRNLFRRGWRCVGACLCGMPGAEDITPGQQQRVSLLVHSRIRERRPRNRVRGLCQRQVQKRQRVGGMSGLPTSLVLECSCGHIELAVPV